MADQRVVIGHPIRSHAGMPASGHPGLRLSSSGPLSVPVCRSRMRTSMYGLSAFRTSADLSHRKAGWRRSPGAQAFKPTVMINPAFRPFETLGQDDLERRTALLVVGKV